MTIDKVRIDKYLWAVRIFKTRSLAAENCENGKIVINGNPVKASHHVKKGEIIFVRKKAFTFQYEVIDIADKRMSAKQVVDFYKEVTPAEEIERMKLHAIAVRTYRMKGEGRPTKKERRALDDFLDF
ncbi:MAG: RNA-binding S4 domain-containing protein [Bacteroidia bacterium]